MSGGGEGAFLDYMINISSVPPAIMTIISLGCLVILGLVVSMRVIFARSSAITLETRIISGLIPFFEILWLGILVMVEKLQSIAEMLSELAKSFGEGVQSAKAKGIDVLIADTAGRLHTKSNLMDELKKVKRIMSKLDEQAPHEVMLVLDA